MVYLTGIYVPFFTELWHFGIIWGGVKNGVWHPGDQPLYYYSMQEALKCPNDYYKPAHIWFAYV